MSNKREWKIRESHAGIVVRISENESVLSVDDASAMADAIWNQIGHLATGRTFRLYWGLSDQSAKVNTGNAEPTPISVGVGIGVGYSVSLDLQEAGDFAEELEASVSQRRLACISASRFRAGYSRYLAGCLW